VRLEVGDSWAEGGGSRLLLVWRTLSSATDLCMVLPSGYDVTVGTCAVYVNDGRGFYMSICDRGRKCIPGAATRCDVCMGRDALRRSHRVAGVRDGTLPDSLRTLQLCPCFLHVSRWISRSKSKSDT
jgi:hypothetical protein